MDIGVHVSFQMNVFIFFGYIRRSGIFESCNSSIFSLWRNPTSTVVASIYIPRNDVERFPLVHILTNIFICCLFHDRHSGRWFWFAFLLWLKILSIFSCKPSLEKCQFRSSDHFLTRFLFLWCRAVWAVYVFWKLTRWQSHHLQMFFPFSSPSHI